MSASRPQPPSSLATDIAFRFVRDLQAGNNPRIEDAVVMAPPAEWETLLHSLIIAEVNARRNGGEYPTLGEYLARFPDSASTLTTLFPQQTPATPVPAPSPAIPVAQFLSVPAPEPPPPEPPPTITPSSIPRTGPIKEPSNRPVWLMIGGGLLMAVVACVAVIMAILPPTKKEPTVVTKNDENKTPVKNEEPPKKGLADPERETAEWILSIGGRGTLQSSKGRVSLAADVDLPKSSFTIEAITLPAQSAGKWKEEDLARLRWREKLMALDLSHPTALTEKALENIKTHPLQTLDLRGTNIGITGAILGELPMLERLTLLSAPLFGDADMVAVGKLSKLHTFKIDSPKITANGFAHLSKLTLLRSLTLGADCTLTPDHIRVIQTVPLEELTSLGGLPDEVLAECAVFLNLKRCLVQQGNIGDSGFKAIAGMRKLEELRIQGARIGNESFNVLCEIKTLQVIELQGTRITDDGVQGLDQLPALRELRLPGSPITDRAAETFANIDSLETLDLSSCNVTDQTLNTLNKHAKLRHLILQRTKVTPKGVDVFRMGTPKCNVVWK